MDFSSATTRPRYVLGRVISFGTDHPHGRVLGAGPGLEAGGAELGARDLGFLRAHGLVVLLFDLVEHVGLDALEVQIRSVQDAQVQTDVGDVDGHLGEVEGVLQVDRPRTVDEDAPHPALVLVHQELVRRFFGHAGRLGPVHEPGPVFALFHVWQATLPLWSDQVLARWRPLAPVSSSDSGSAAGSGSVPAGSSEGASSAPAASASAWACAALVSSSAAAWAALACSASARALATRSASFPCTPASAPASSSRAASILSPTAPMLAKSSANSLSTPAPAASSAATSRLSEGRPVGSSTPS